ncbi:ABC transporter ATP-binding protein [Bacillus sp. FJAT-50079]|uniref:ABC transporter ATP-binding protein n=1 Tax=Bacillus sp. FJAT-50079 TaxID=2833577 RepID=UPI001BC9844B|nr:ABC transporter ATP-binding protein [Bacillus sp. FJAT-50079]MBS4206549.1 ABC transporter ATP-binding protein [Bacillus sp. FJAT-50079]
MLEVVELTKHFKQHKAVQGINLYLERGEIVGLLGPNGAGKSTAIAMMSSLISPTAGEVRFQQVDVLKNPQLLRAKLGVVPQELALYEDLTARENLEFFGRIQKMKNPELKRKIDEVLTLIGLDDQGKKLVKHFSGGMKRRLNIGAALLHEPEILIMDEPTVGIDPQSRNYILDSVKRLNKELNMTILYTSHYMEEVEFLCDRIYIMDRGTIIAAGTKDEIKHILAAEQTIQVRIERHNQAFIHMLKAEPVISSVDERDQLMTIVASKDVPLFSTIFSLAEETGAVILGIEIQTPTLEDVFLHLTGRALRN